MMTRQIGKGSSGGRKKAARKSPPALAPRQVVQGGPHHPVKISAGQRVTLKRPFDKEFIILLSADESVPVANVSYGPYKESFDMPEGIQRVRDFESEIGELVEVRGGRGVVTIEDTGSTEIDELNRAYQEHVEEVMAIADDEVRHEVFGELASDESRYLAADLVEDALRESGVSLREIESRVGIGYSQVCRIANGSLENGPSVRSLARIAMALGKRLKISFE
jgi:hypothetical protein